MKYPAKRYCDYCHQWIDVKNYHSFAGHRTTCKDKPNRDEWIKLKTKVWKEGKKEHIFTCETCGKTFIVKSYNRPKRKYCSVKCNSWKHPRTDELLECPWCGEFKKVQGNGIMAHVWRIHTESGKTFKNGRRGISSWNKGLTKETSEKIRTSGEKISQKLKGRPLTKVQLLKKEKRRDSLTKYQKYFEDSKFRFNLYKYPDEFDLTLIEKYGWFRNSNQNGISRDHMISISHGFKNNILPELLAHPANCKLMHHRENDSKNGKCSITLEGLKERIKTWDEKYKQINL